MLSYITPEAQPAPVSTYMTASTGCPVLDGMMGGGVPQNRSVLVTGGPGTGKSTLAMQFLQRGLSKGDEALYISTEQRFAELADSFDGFDFDLDHERLRFATIHAATGESLEGGSGSLVLKHLGDEGFDSGEMLGPQFDAPFTVQHIEQYLDHYAPCDRVVFDSVSGLAAIADDPAGFRRTVLELVRFFSEEFGATTVFTAEGGAGTESVTTPLRYATHGVIELTRERINDDPHRFLEVTKLRGVDHDRRRVEMELVDGGVRVGPARRSQPPVLKTHRHTPVGIDGLDALCGGGLATGTGVLLEHDGYANLGALFGAVVRSVLDREGAVTLVPTIRLRPEGVEAMLSETDHTVEGLLADDRLFVVDMIGAWDETHRNVFAARETPDGLRSALEIGDERAGDRPQVSLVNTDVLVNTLGADAARTLRYRQEGRLDPDDLLLHVHNPSVSGDEIGGFYTNAAEQVLRTWISDDGLQYVTLEKSPCGFIGTTSLVEYIEEPPYLRVQEPPMDRENPYAE
jgi:KaiC/GvpD/RAD55 family RecA-like ATPase